jgi:hypothetical protein
MGVHLLARQHICWDWRVHLFRHRPGRACEMGLQLGSHTKMKLRELIWTILAIVAIAGVGFIVVTFVIKR